MTTITRKTKAAVALMVTFAAVSISAPAFADGYQKDVQTCRAAMTAQSNIDMSEYRLRFEKVKGKRVRTVYLKAIPHKGGEAFRFSCSLNRNQVTALNSIGKEKMFALRKLASETKTQTP